MTMEVLWLVSCNHTGCPAKHEGKRPEARAAGWSCDSPRGLDHCPDHLADGPTYRPLGLCAFCGKRLSVSKTGLPTAHTTDLVTRCPGSYMTAKPLPGGAS